MKPSRTRVESAGGSEGVPEDGEIAPGSGATVAELTELVFVSLLCGDVVLEEGGAIRIVVGTKSLSELVVV